jgi:Leucine-rich repeat (LRR) protein
MISDALIRRESGQYDPEIISKLRLEKLSITRISGLNRCVNLVELSLAWNDIAEMNGLKDCILLRKLDLSHNKIKMIGMSLSLFYLLSATR